MFDDRQYNAEDVENALKNSDEFRNYFRDARDICDAMYDCPNYAQKIVDHLLTHTKDFQHYFVHISQIGNIPKNSRLENVEYDSNVEKIPMNVSSTTIKLFNTMNLNSIY